MSEAVHDAQRLLELQALPLERKIQITQARIIEWYKHYHGNVVVSFSGGKDSTVLLHLVRQLYPDVRAVFSNTGLEYPEIQRFVKSFDNVDIVTPAMRFDQVISTYGYPLISKEVAEAIYYARRLRSQNGNVERERAEQESGCENAPNSWAEGQTGVAGSKDSRIPQKATGEMTSPSTHTHTQSGTANGWNCTADAVSGDRPQTGQPLRQTTWKRLEIGGGEKNRLIQTSGARNRRTVLQGKMWGRVYLNGAGVVPTGQTGEGGVFSNPDDQFGGKSQFNKEKYLPLARDIPVLVSHYCCMEMKKKPMKKYQHKNKLYPLLGTLADESRTRKQAWIRHGCNAFESKSPTSQPLSFWTEQDILTYIAKYQVEIASVYGEIIAVDENGNEYPARELIVPACKLKCEKCDRTGCVFCGFGFHNERGETRFQRLAKTHPRQYEFAISGGQWVDNPYYDPTAPKMDGEWQNWNPKQIWVPSKKGLGMGKVFDMVNEIYGKDFYRYE